MSARGLSLDLIEVWKEMILLRAIARRVFDLIRRFWNQWHNHFYVLLNTQPVDVCDDTSEGDGAPRALGQAWI